MEARSIAHIAVLPGIATAMIVDPWGVSIELTVQVDTQMLGEICIDNEQDVKLYKK